MVVQQVTKSDTYTASGANATFEFGFYAVSTDDLRVSVDGVDWSIATAEITDAGGSVTLVNIPAEGAQVVVYRQTEKLQETELVNGAAFYPKVIETAIDKLTMICQELKEEIDRCLKSDITDSGLDISYVNAIAQQCETYLATIKEYYDALIGEYTLPGELNTAQEALQAAYAAASALQSAIQATTKKDALDIDIEEINENKIAFPDYDSQVAWTCDNNTLTLFTAPVTCYFGVRAESSSGSYCMSRIIRTMEDIHIDRTDIPSTGGTTTATVFLKEGDSVYFSARGDLYRAAFYCPLI